MSERERERKRERETFSPSHSLLLSITLSHTQTHTHVHRTRTRRVRRWQYSKRHSTRASCMLSEATVGISATAYSPAAAALRVSRNIYTHICTHTHTHTHMFIHAYVYIYVYVCVCVCMYIYTQRGSLEKWEHDAARASRTSSSHSGEGAAGKYGLTHPCLNRSVFRFRGVFIIIAILLLLL